MNLYGNLFPRLERTKRHLVMMFILIFPVTVNNSALAETVITCDGIEGYTYFSEGALVPREKEGWAEDKISNGRYSVTLDKDNNFDILFLDASGNLKSARANSEQLVVVGFEKSFLSIFVKYTESVNEFYTFDINKKIMFYSIHRFNALVNKAGTFTANCK